MDTRNPGSTKVIGILIICLALYLLLAIMVRVPFASVALQYWPLTLVLLGLVMMAGVKERLGAGAIITLVGLLGLANNTGVLTSAAGQSIGGLLLFLLGILVLVSFTGPKSTPEK